MDKAVIDIVRMLILYYNYKPRLVVVCPNDAYAVFSGFHRATHGSSGDDDLTHSELKKSSSK